MSVTLHAFLVRKAGLTHEEFLSYWHDQHGPLIRDTPALARHLIRYEQHGSLPGAQAGSDFDGVAVQDVRLVGRLPRHAGSGPRPSSMREDEANFLDSDKHQVLFTEDVVTMVRRPGRRALSGPLEGRRRGHPAALRHR